MQEIVKRRLELLNLEAFDVSKPEIVAQLSKKYECNPSTIYRDFKNRHLWQPNLQGFEDQKQALVATVNTLKKLRKKARAKLYFEPKSKTKKFDDKEEVEETVQLVNENVKVAWAKIIIETTLKMYELMYPTSMQHDLFIHKEMSKPQVDFSSLPEKDRKVLLKAVEVVAEAKLREVT